ncbi:MAG TPA: Wzz/FepE/Etk N-terminal domain-containing protein [Rhodocyclaceae bacterium]|nr:Wzz/FepE/Etk N-terminal domain-containing protein [Rhodocyclaceae bacterium]
MATEINQSPVRDDDEIDLLELVKTLWSERRFIVLFSLLICALAAGYSLTIPPSFKAEAVVQIKGSSSSSKGGVAALAGFASVAGISMGGDQTLEATMGILRSKELVRSFIRSEKLIDTLLNSEEKGVSLPSPSQLIGKTIGGGEDKQVDPERQLELARETFTKGVMTLSEDKKTGLVTISIAWKDPAIAADWANRFVAMANSHLRELAIDRAQKNLEHLNTELPKASVVAVQQSIYRLIEEQVKSIMVAVVEREYAIRVIDPATKPLRKDSPKRALMVMLAGLAAGMLAIVIVLIRKRYAPDKPWRIRFLNAPRKPAGV